MSTFIKLFEDFVQKKENDVKGVVALPEEEDECEQQPHFVEPVASVSQKANQQQNSSSQNSVAVTQANQACTNKVHKMEHSYMRDGARPTMEITGLAPARTILVRPPPQCPNCFTHPLDEHEMDDGNQVPIPSYNEITAKEDMNECGRIAKYVKKSDNDDENWQANVKQIGWNNTQKDIFEKIARILDDDYLARLVNSGRPHEPVQRRLLVDKSSARVRTVFAKISWDPRLTQWLHHLLIEILPSTYMACYLDILRTLNSKLPTLVEKMLFGRPLTNHQELLAPVLKEVWEPNVIEKIRKLNHDAVIVVLPSLPFKGTPSKRIQKWHQQLNSITELVTITLPTTAGQMLQQPLDQIAEIIVSLTRVRIQELRQENATRSIILVGFNAGAAMALQVAMSETVAAVICMGFAYNTLYGVRGTPDDRILDIKVPILFVIGRISAKTSTEEIEFLRERMISETSVLIVGGADDLLRVSRKHCQNENVTQSMVDSMIVDEVYDYIKKVLTNPPGTRVPVAVTGPISYKTRKLDYNASGELTNISSGVAAVPAGGSKITVQRKRKLDSSHSGQEHPPHKTKVSGTTNQTVARPRKNVATISPKDSTSKILHTSSTPISVGKFQPHLKTMGDNNLSNDELSMAMQSILSDSNDLETSLNSSAESNSQKSVTNFELVASTKGSSPGKTVLQRHSVVSGTGGGNNISIKSPFASGAKIKMIPSNQFMQLKPPMHSQSKIYTIKPPTVANSQQGSTATNIGSIVSTSAINSAAAASGQQQIFTLKSPNGQTKQFVTAISAQQKLNFLKHTTSGANIQLNTSVSGAKNAKTTANVGNVDLASIIDMPIIFADKDGNLTDSMNTTQHTSANNTISTSTNSTSSVGQLIISQKIIQEAASNNSTLSGNSSATASVGKTSVVLQKPLAAGTTSLQLQPRGVQHPQLNKLMIFNRGTNVITRPPIPAATLQKYSKMIVSSTKSSSTAEIGKPLYTLSNAKPIAFKPTINIGGGLTRQPHGVLNVNTKTLPQIQILNSQAAQGAGVSGSEKGQSGVRNILIKPTGGLKQFPQNLKSQLINRNLTVRKLVNFMPAVGSSTVATTSLTAKPITVTSNAVAGELNQKPSSSNSLNVSSMQSAPKIFKLNPINPLATSSAQPKSE